MTFAADRPIRWGILGTGRIASAFTADLALVPDAEVAAVGSRSPATAAAFAARFGISRAHGTYEDLVADPDVDVVYVSTPHALHHDHALLAIRAGKAVLVEKPFTLDVAQAGEVVAAARTAGTFLMEAMWTRFLPHVVRIRELVAAGRLGDVRSLTADIGEWFPPDAAHRLFAPELGGGALLDLGVYPLSFASMLFGAPRRVTAVSDPAFTGVDAQTTVVTQYDGGRQAALFATLEARSGCRAGINGTRARIETDGSFFTPGPFRVVDLDGSVEVHDVAHSGRGLCHQAAEVGRCLRAGETESPVLPLVETLSVLATMDEVRRQIGLRYPAEVRGAGGPGNTDGTRPTAKG
ncbi:MAG TPA: Gfo/Idh/MocA family oxidoreductase [Mycobacteriales bacterium]|jgi:predicted dehydrogenase